MWLLQEAAKRNPAVQSYLLSWGVPHWVGNSSFFSAENIDYQVGYAKCVHETVGGAHPHYIGIWVRALACAALTSHTSQRVVRCAQSPPAP